MKKNALRLIVSVLLFTTLLLMLYQPAYAHGPYPFGHGGHRETVVQFVRADVGGVLQADGVTLTIPAGALYRDRVVFMQVQVYDQGAGGEVRLLPSLKLKVPATLNFGRNLSEVYYFENGDWVSIPANQGVIQIDHFSRFGWW